MFLKAAILLIFILPLYGCLDDDSDTKGSGSTPSVVDNNNAIEVNDQDAGGEDVTDKIIPIKDGYYIFEEAFVTPLIEYGAYGLDDRRQRFLQVSFAIKSNDALFLKEVQEKEDRLKHNFNRLLSRSDYSFLRTHEGRLKLQEDLTDLLGQTLSHQSSQPYEVLITDFVLQ